MLNKQIKFNKNISVTDSSIFLLLLRILDQKNKIVYFTENTESSINLKNKIESVNSNVEILILPEFDCDFFSNLSPTKQILDERISCLSKLLFSNKRIIFLISYSSAITKTIPRSYILENNLSIKKKNTYDQIVSFLKKNSYENVEVLRGKGEYVLRGQIIDIFSPIEDFPVRILFDIDKIESISLFDENNQKKINDIEEYNLIPSSEIFFDEKNIKNFRESFRRLKIKDKDQFYKAISNKIIIPGSEQFFPILNDKYESIFDFIKNFTVILNRDYESLYNQYYHDLTTEVRNKNENFLTTNFYMDLSKFKKNIEKFDYFLLSNVYDSQNATTLFSSRLHLKKKKNENLIDLPKFFKEKKNQFFFCFSTNYSKNKIESFFKNKSIKYELVTSSIYKIKIKQNLIFLLNCPIDFSFKLELDDKNSYFLSDNDFFERIKKSVTHEAFNKDDIINEFNEINIGDIVVHIDHGIAKFNGLIKKKINTVEQEFIELVYYNNDKLFIPIENLDLISRFGFSKNNVQLDKLGLQNWQNRKAILKNRVKEIAKDLIKIAAKRELMKSINMSPNFLEYDKFSSEFEFTETSDQLKSIKEIEEDLSKAKPMDRLICGDVGFGKTEIAMRAAFLILSSGFQVAIVCPKVLLVEQHFKTFCKRFLGYKYVIEKISRFESPQKKKKIKQNLYSGSINLIIGTHAILSGDIRFNNLGLIIIDEEQSFGVEQKEKLKQIKPNVHILTMSATPIPRTLQSSLLKLRDISLIKTAPVNRLNIKTYLMIIEDNLIRRIIKTELNRNGQIFFVTPRIVDIEEIKKKLYKIIPELNFAIIHSKLETLEIEKIYTDFFNKKIDLLLSTAMIESGLDISNVNTILIYKPHLFGLSQLYQLRGRVGRSSDQAYAYLILDKNIKLSEEKLQRLQLISKINKLGAGFSIAANDLDLRGAGNIIGSEQSGHIREVGIELYYKMLNETVSELRNEKSYKETWSPNLNLGFSFNIPSNYIENLDIRMQIYKKISEITEIEDLNRIVKDLENRFGKAPGLFINLFKIIEIKILCKKLQIKKIDFCPDGFVIEIKQESFDYTEKLINLAKVQSEKIKLLPNSKFLLKIHNNKIINKAENLIFFLKSFN